MLDWQLEEPENDLHEDEMEYEAFLKETCRCEDNECECISFSKFQVIKMKDMQDYWENYESSEDEEGLA